MAIVTGIASKRKRLSLSGKTVLGFGIECQIFKIKSHLEGSIHNPIMPPTPSTSKSAIAKRKALGDPDSEIEVITEPKSASRKNASTKKATSINGSAKKAAPSKSKGKGKAKSNQSDEDDEDNEDDYNDEVEDVKPKKKVATATNASKKADGNPPKKKAKLEEEEEGEEEEEKQRMNEKLGTEFGVSVWKKGEAKTGPSAPGQYLFCLPTRFYEI